MKRRILPMLALFASLTLASCGGNTKKSSSSPAPESSSAPISSVEPASSSEEITSSSIPEESSEEPQEPEWVSDKNNHWQVVDGSNVNKAKHTYVVVAPEDDNNVPEGGKKAKAATCSEAGVKVEICSVCGYRKESNISKLDHEWDEGQASGACGSIGSVTYTCKNCDETKEVASTYVPHDWEVTGTVAASGEGVEYETIKCKKCQTEGLRVAAAKATINGTDKGGAPEGCIKLSNADETMTVKINVEGAKTGKFYLRGCMDYWHDGSNDNQDKTYSECKSSSNDVNFSVTVNGNIVDLSETKNTKFGVWLPEAAGETITNSSGTAVTYSQEGDCECGATSLQDGLNTIVFTRIDSYNLAVKYFVIAFDAAA